MWSFHTFKDKRYWILLIPSIIISVLFSVFAADYILETPSIALISIIIYIILFWSTYHLWKYFGDRKKNATDEESDL